MTKRRNIIPAERIAQSIYVIRGQRVILDADLAKLYGVQSGRLNEAVKRNTERFPGDFMFQLTVDEYKGLLSQSAISKGRGGRRTPPYAFTEHGVAMLSSVLRSQQAIQVNILIVRAFVRYASSSPATRNWPAKWKTWNGSRPSTGRIFGHCLTRSGH